MLPKATSFMRKAQGALQRKAPVISAVRRGAATVSALANTPVGALVPFSKQIGLAAKGVEKGAALAQKFAAAKI